MRTRSVTNNLTETSLRRGVSLIELMVVIAVISILFGMVGVVFHRLFLAEQVAMRAALTERTVSRLSDQIRRDVHAATDAKQGVTEDGLPPRLELSTTPDAATGTAAAPIVVYSIDDGSVLRELVVDGKASSREVYRLPECQIRFPAATNEATAAMVGLIIERQGSTVTPQPQAVRPRRSLVIEAALGRDNRLAAALGTKLPTTVQEESK